MALSRLLDAVKGSANRVDAGTRGRIQRSVRVYECEGCEVDPATVDRAGRYLCLAAIAPSRVLHQTETHIDLRYGWLEDDCTAAANGPC